VLKRPADESEHGVGGGFGRHVGVRIEPVQDAQPPEGQVAEHVLGDQRRPEQQDHVGEHDRARHRSQRQAPRGRQHQQVARAHDQQQRLEAPARQAHPEAAQRAGQPGGPAAAARRYELGRRGRGAGAQQQHGRHHPDQAQRAERLGDARGDAGARAPAGAGARRAGEAS